MQGVEREIFSKGLQKRESDKLICFDQESRGTVKGFPLGFLAKPDHALLAYHVLNTLISNQRL
jgi:hypothetical protein